MESHLPRPLRTLILECLLLATALAAAPAGAGGQLDWDVIQMNQVGCANGATQFTTEVSGYSGGPERFRTIVDANGLRYMDEDAGQPGGNGTYGWSLYTSSSGGPISASFPLPAGIPFTVDFRFISGPGGPTVFLRRLVISQCNGGVILSEVVILFVDGFESGLTLNWSSTVP